MSALAAREMLVGIGMSWVLKFMKYGGGSSNLNDRARGKGFEKVSRLLKMESKSSLVPAPRCCRLFKLIEEEGSARGKAIGLAAEPG